MTPETQDKEQGSLTSLLTGAAVGAGATLLCLYNPSLTPYVAAAGAAAACAATGGVAVEASVASVAAGGAAVAIAAGVAVTSFPGATIVAAVPLIPGVYAGFYLHSKYGEQGAFTRIRRFAASGLLTAAVLTGGYFVGRSQSDITDVIPQEQGLEIKQADGRTTPFTEQADGTYLPLEQRLSK